jgi:TIR domain
VFLSHATQDRDHVELVRRQISALGVDVYLAEHDPQPGRSIAKKVQTAIETSHVVVVLITMSSAESAYVQQEVGLARAYRRIIVPIVDSSVDRTRLGILTELEHLELDTKDPTAMLANMSQVLQRLVLAQNASTSVAVTIAPNTPDIGMTVVLAGLGLLLLYLLVAR